MLSPLPSNGCPTIRIDHNHATIRSKDFLLCRVAYMVRIEREEVVSHKT